MAKSKEINIIKKVPNKSISTKNYKVNKKNGLQVSKKMKIGTDFSSVKKKKKKLTKNDEPLLNVSFSSNDSKKVKTCKQFYKPAESDIEENNFESVADSDSEKMDAEVIKEDLEMEEESDNHHISVQSHVESESKGSNILDPKFFKPPTREELNNLKEAEYLFQSSLFRMQITEILKKITIKEKNRRLLEDWLISFKKIIKNIPVPSNEDQIIKLEMLSKSSINLPLVQVPPSSNFLCEYFPPEDIQICGSFPLGVSIKPNVIVDISLFIPDKIFQKKDYLNHNYHRKQTYYLGYIAAHLKTQNIGELSFGYLDSDHVKLVLLLKPDEGNLKKHFTIRIMPAISRSVFKMSRFIPKTSNAFPELPKESDQQYTGTPHYNSTILLDMTIASNMEFLKNALQDTSSLKEGIQLLRIWLRQRELDQGYGCFSGFILSMFVAYLLLNRKLNRQMSSYQMVRCTWLALATSDWIAKGITLAKKQSHPLQPTLEEFHNYFEVVFIDPTGFVNLCANMSALTFQRVKYEAKLANELLKKTEIDCFEALFLMPMPFVRTFDYIVHLNLTESEVLSFVKKFQLYQFVSDYSRNCYPFLKTLIVDLLNKAMLQRLKLSFVKLQSLDQWSLSENAPTWNNKSYNISLGFLLNKDTFQSVLDKGPSADSPEAIEFRDFWKTKSELRRFQDGSICEAVVWDCTNFCKKREIIFQIIAYLLHSYFDIAETSLKFAGCHLDSLLELPSKLTLPEKYPLYGTGEEINIILYQTFNRLIKEILAIKDLPLSITSVQGISASFRCTETFVPLPGYSMSGSFSKKFRRVPKNDLNAPQWVPALEVNIAMESTSKWPQDIEAIKRVKVAFHQNLSDLIRKMYNLVTVPHPEYVDVIKDGFVFRLRIIYYREPTIMKFVKDPSGLLKMEDIPEAEYLQYRLETLPQLTSMLHSLDQATSCFGNVCRLTKRWLSAQMLLDYFNEISVELIIAYLFLHPEPFSPPCSAAVGFLRFLNLLISFDWKMNPLIVNLNKSLSGNDYAEIHKVFSNSRTDLPLLFISTPLDKFTSYTTKEKPSGQILKRTIQLAQASLTILQDQSLEVTGIPDYKLVFRPSLKMYDVLIYLKRENIPKIHQNIDPPTLWYHANLSHVNNETVPVTNFDPVSYFLQELKEAYDEFALFFYDSYGGDVIAVLWKPDAFLPVSFKIANVNGRILSTKGSTSNLIPNTVAIVESFEILGKGLVLKVEVQAENWKIS